MSENPESVGQAAVEELQELRQKIFEDPSLELDTSTKRLRQANFKQQYKLRQERSCQELTDVEQEALRACRDVGVLGDLGIEDVVQRNSAARPVENSGAPAAAWNQAFVAGMRGLPSMGINANIDGLFLAEKHAQSASQRQYQPVASRAKVCTYVGCTDALQLGPIQCIFRHYLRVCICTSCSCMFRRRWHKASVLERDRDANTPTVLWLVEHSNVVELCWDMQSPERTVAQFREEPSQDEPKPDDSHLPLAARRGRRATKKRRYHLSDSDEAEEQHTRVSAPKHEQVDLSSRPLCVTDNVVTGHGMLPNMAPHLYLQYTHMPGACQQLPDYYSMAHDPFSAGMAGPCGPLSLVHEPISMQGTAQGMPAWHGQLPMDPSLAHRSGVLSTQGSDALRAQGSSNMQLQHGTATMMNPTHPLRLSGQESECGSGLDSLPPIAPLGPYSHSEALQHVRHY